ncbi:hypothetical protein DPMN_135226 [Dreissena polymorpha]|uniref:Uncharacterized protein n=1 Tax=Dreissena polymorpha TaxID=45954 RepID=A0A9D4JFL1_DREPO|nr:hypothetical protein DPMN_135226 [Dreissena polymorpha]
MNDNDFSHSELVDRLALNIIKTNLLTKFHEDRTVNVASRKLTKKNSRPLAAMLFNQLASFFHKDWTIHVASSVKNAPTKTIFKLIQDIIGTNLLTKFHEDRKNKSIYGQMPRPRGGHVFQATGIMF